MTIEAGIQVSERLREAEKQLSERLRETGIQVLAEGSDWLAVNKPSGLVVIPARDGDKDDCLKARLEAQLGRHLLVVHRLDRGTSGVVLFAKDAAAHRRLCMDFEHRRLAKTYHALVYGAPPQERGTIDVALHTARKGKMRPAQRGEIGALSALTRYQVVNTRGLGELGRISLVQLEPMQGRQHQLRVHMRAIEYPILGDELYGKAIPAAVGEQLPETRLQLHASMVVLPATDDGAAISITAPAPRYFKLG
jgi:RluA family pseudouridine synthase